MNLKFEQLAQQILRENTGGLRPAGEDGEEVQQSDRNAGERSGGGKGFDRYTVDCPKTGKMYTFAAKKEGSREKAHALAKKLGSKAIFRSRHV